ncbi:uncharacterized protein LTR77_005017 [Saxophila tyrrhenica]|uniref:CBM-cenC domain-containing protein n=1 Tax=Saxophila tyrrhenica TaxID=1690608 RepID=A0AAV9PAP6_9PEZI|nr:hypothetical protein LTR77_005017 [Saxophila tyrrhenica]
MMGRQYYKAIDLDRTLTAFQPSFEAGDVIPFSTWSSSAGVSAKIVDGGPVAPASGSNYLLITYIGASSSRKVRRQASGIDYVLTQTVSTISGLPYTISAEAIEADNNGNPSSCSVQICGGGACGSRTPLTNTYQTYSYSFVPSSGFSSTISLSFTCQGAAYVGVDNVRVATNSTSGEAQTPYATTTIYRTVTASTGGSAGVQTRTITLGLNGTAPAEITRTVTAPAQNASQPTTCPTITQTSIVSSLSVSTVYQASLNGTAPSEITRTVTAMASNITTCPTITQTSIVNSLLVSTIYQTDVNGTAPAEVTRTITAQARNISQLRRALPSSKQALSTRCRSALSIRPAM